MSTICLTALVLAAVSLASPAAAADVLVGRVVAIADGDTVTVLDGGNVQHKVRLADIDAPEKAQDFGTKAREALASKVQGREVTVESHGTDRYKRTIGTVLVDGRNVNLEMVAEGWAWHYKAYSKSQEFADAEKAARAAGLGLWAGKNPVPPWEFRRTEAERKAAARGARLTAPRQAVPLPQSSGSRSMSGKVPAGRPY